ncbi:hypothetical protein [Acinetobacter towneri]|uniref:Uncharacterized protein n=1 Tax=Acinetobacter towneri TaxID=202956 RepID=A0ABX7THC8_9GAMM|nr:hypothetical protein [Acinetobacter towneri]QTD62668.1 hypothetical protein J4G45_05800 [Acinetobacter towneri]
MRFHERVISDFGGYEKCKDILSQPNIDLIMNAHGLREHMLEYRRQHNIFEVGDKVVFGSGLNADLFTIKSKPKKKNGVLLLPVILSNGSWFDLMEQFVRHATDEEIKVGKRLEVNQ